jgi:hypothetical protein
MRLILLTLLVAGVAAFSGCGKKPPTAASTPNPPDSAQAPASQPPVNNTAKPPQVYSAPASPAVVSTQNGEPDLKQINRAYVGWIMRTQKHAKTFEEFVTASGIQIPPPPAGKKFIIDKRGYIALVSQ